MRRLFFLFISSFFILPAWVQNETRKPQVILANEAGQKQLKQKGKEALAFCLKKKYNQQFCILVNMGLHSGLNRMVIWDLQHQKVLKSFPVSHGCGEHWWGFTNSKERAEFSNKDGSHLSSLGKYRIGQRAGSDWGVNIKYLLHGLEASNSNALPRQIVFHSWSLVSDDAVYPSGTPEGWGCPAISNKNFLWLDPLLQKSNKPVLFWIYR